MIRFIGPRGTNKTHDLLELANKAQGVVVTDNKRALEVKAHAYGFYDITFVEYSDLVDGNYYLGSPTFIHQVDKYIKFVTQNVYGLDCKAYSVTEEQ